MPANTAASTIVQLSFGKLKLYAPSFADRRRLAGWAVHICTSIVPGSTSRKVFDLRITAKILESEEMMGRVYSEIAALCDKPNKITKARVHKLTKSFSDKASPADTMLMFSHLCEIADIDVFAVTDTNV